MSKSDNISSSFSEDGSLASQALNLLKPGIQECDTLQVYIKCTVITSYIESDTCCLQWSSTSAWLKTSSPLKEPISATFAFQCSYSCNAREQGDHLYNHKRPSV